MTSTYKRLLAAATLGFAACAHGTGVSWDATADFNATTTANPNGVWGYGYDPASLAGYQFKAFDFFGTVPTLYWLDSSYNSLGTPSFGKNVTGGVINGLPPGQLFLHPGPVPNDDAAILRFTVPASGLFSVDARFYAGDSSETDAWVVLNGNFAAPLAALGITSVNPVYSAAALALAAGDTLDFVVGNHGSYNFDTTPLSVQIAAVPEPPAWALAMLGCLGWLGLAARRARGRASLHALVAAGLVWLAGPAIAQDPPPSKPEDCSGLLCQLGRAVSDGPKQGMGGKSFGEAIASGVQDKLAGKTPQVLGYVNLGNGEYLTFFDTNPGGFPSTGRPLSVPPKPGTVPPPMALVPVNVKKGMSVEGAMLANNIDEMKKHGVFVAAAPVAPRTGATAAADEAARTVPRVLAVHNGKKYQTSLHNCATFDELGPDDQPTGRQVSPNGALFDALGRCETRLSAFRRAQMDALEKESQVSGKR